MKAVKNKALSLPPYTCMFILWMCAWSDRQRDDESSPCGIVGRGSRMRPFFHSALTHTRLAWICCIGMLAQEVSCLVPDAVGFRVASTHPSPPFFASWIRECSFVWSATGVVAKCTQSAHLHSRVRGEDCGHLLAHTTWVEWRLNYRLKSDKATHSVCHLAVVVGYSGFCTDMYTLPKVLVYN